MWLTINNFIDALKNPSESFKTLEGCTVVKCEKEIIHECCVGNIIIFCVNHNNNHYKLYTWLNEKVESGSQQKQISEFLTNCKSDFLVKYSYYPQELLLFDNNGKFHYRDVVLEERVTGDKLSSHLHKLMDAGDVAELLYMVGKIINLNTKLKELKFSLKTITPETIYVASDGKLKLTSYHSAISSKEEEYERSKTEDHLALFCIGFSILMAASEVAELQKSELVTMNIFEIREMLPAVIDLCVHDDDRELLSKINLLIKRNEVLSHTEELFVVLSELNSRQRVVELSKKMPFIAQSRMNYVKYDSIGSFYENVAVVSRDSKFGYVNRDFKELTPLKYTYAQEICEGYGIIHDGDMRGVIDKTGREILKPEYEDVVSPDRNGVLIVCQEGKWWLKNCNGTDISTTKFDMIADFYGQYAPARLDNKWGIIDKKSKIIVPCVCDHINKHSDLDKEFRLYKGNQIITWVPPSEA